MFFEKFLYLSKMSKGGQHLITFIFKFYVLKVLHVKPMTISLIILVKYPGAYNHGSHILGTTTAA